MHAEKNNFPKYIVIDGKQSYVYKKTCLLHFVCATKVSTKQEARFKVNNVLEASAQVYIWKCFLWHAFVCIDYSGVWFTTGQMDEQILPPSVRICQLRNVCTMWVWWPTMKIWHPVTPFPVPAQRHWSARQQPQNAKLCNMGYTTDDWHQQAWWGLYKEEQLNYFGTLSNLLGETTPFLWHWATL